MDDGATDLGAHRYFRDARGAGVEAVLLDLATSMAQSPPQDLWELKVNVARKLFEAWFENYARIVEPAPILRGDELMGAFDLKPGPMIGDLLVAIAEEQVEGSVDTAEQVMEFARRWLQLER